MRCPDCGDSDFKIVSGGEGAPHVTYECIGCNTRICHKKVRDECFKLRSPYRHNSWIEIDMNEITKVKVIFT